MVQLPQCFGSTPIHINLLPTGSLSLFLSLTHTTAKQTSVAGVACDISLSFAIKCRGEVALNKYSSFSLPLSLSLWSFLIKVTSNYM